MTLDGETALLHRRPADDDDDDEGMDIADLLPEANSPTAHKTSAAQQEHYGVPRDDRAEEGAHPHHHHGGNVRRGDAQRSSRHTHHSSRTAKGNDFEASVDNVADDCVFDDHSRALSAPADVLGRAFFRRSKRPSEAKSTSSIATSSSNAGDTSSHPPTSSSSSRKTPHDGSDSPGKQSKKTTPEKSNGDEKTTDSHSASLSRNGATTSTAPPSCHTGFVSSSTATDHSPGAHTAVATNNSDDSDQHVSGVAVGAGEEVPLGTVPSICGDTALVSMSASILGGHSSTVLGSNVTAAGGGAETNHRNASLVAAGGGGSMNVALADSSDAVLGDSHCCHATLADDAQPTGVRETPASGGAVIPSSGPSGGGGAYPSAPGGGSQRPVGGGGMRTFTAVAATERVEDDNTTVVGDGSGEQELYDPETTELAVNRCQSPPPPVPHESLYEALSVTVMLHYATAEQRVKWLSAPLPGDACINDQLAKLRREAAKQKDEPDNTDIKDDIAKHADDKVKDQREDEKQKEPALKGVLMVLSEEGPVLVQVTPSRSGGGDAPTLSPTRPSSGQPPVGGRAPHRRLSLGEASAVTGSDNNVLRRPSDLCNLFDGGRAAGPALSQSSQSLKADSLSIVKTSDAVAANTTRAPGGANTKTTPLNQAEARGGDGDVPHDGVRIEPTTGQVVFPKRKSVRQWLDRVGTTTSDTAVIRRLRNATPVSLRALSAMRKKREEEGYSHTASSPLVRPPRHQQSQHQLTQLPRAGSIGRQGSLEMVGRVGSTDRTGTIRKASSASKDNDTRGAPANPSKSTTHPLATSQIPSSAAGCGGGGGESEDGMGHHAETSSSPGLSDESLGSPRRRGASVFLAPELMPRAPTSSSNPASVSPAIAFLTRGRSPGGANQPSSTPGGSSSGGPNSSSERGGSLRDGSDGGSGSGGGAAVHTPRKVPSLGHESPLLTVPTPHLRSASQVSFVVGDVNALPAVPPDAHERERRGKSGENNTNTSDVTGSQGVGVEGHGTPPERSTVLRQGSGDVGRAGQHHGQPSPTSGSGSTPESHHSSPFAHSFGDHPFASSFDRDALRKRSAGSATLLIDASVDDVGTHVSDLIELEDERRVSRARPLYDDDICSN